jgi:transcriptional regulator with XRE-family HTH domain
MKPPRPRLPKQSFGCRLREMRIEAGLSLRLAARKAGISPSFLTDVEYNRRMPSHLHVERLAAAVGRPAAELREYDPRENIAAVLDVFATHPEIVSPLTKVCEKIAQGSLTLTDLERFAED